MRMVLYVEASQPCGKIYRLGLGCYMPPALISAMIILFGRLI